MIFFLFCHLSSLFFSILFLGFTFLIFTLFLRSCLSFHQSIFQFEKRKIVMKNSLQGFKIKMSFTCVLFFFFLGLLLLLLVKLKSQIVFIVIISYLIFFSEKLYIFRFTSNFEVASNKATPKLNITHFSLLSYFLYLIYKIVIRSIHLQQLLWRINCMTKFIKMYKSLISTMHIIWQNISPISFRLSSSGKLYFIRS